MVRYLCACVGEWTADLAAIILIVYHDSVYNKYYKDLLGYAYG